MSQTDSDSGNTFDGRIWVRDGDRDWVNEHKRGDETQADVLARLIEFYETHDPDAETAAPDADALADAVAERVAVTAEVDPDAVAAALAERIDTGADPAAIAKATADEVEQRLR